MVKCPIRLHLDGKNDKSFYVCALCECPLGTHCFYVHCPLLEDELICIDCCQNEVEKDDIIKKFKEIGKEYTREEIDSACKACGNRSCGTVIPEERP